MDLGSPEQALAYLEQALALTEDPSQRALLLDLAGEAASRANALVAAVEHLEAAISAHLEAADADAAGVSTARMAQALSGLGGFSTAIARTERMLSELGVERERPGPEQTWLHHFRLAEFLRRVGAGPGLG